MESQRKDTTLVEETIIDAGALARRVVELAEDKQASDIVMLDLRDTGWILLDYGDVVIHIFSSALRDFYRIEQLWNKATPVVIVQ